MCGAVLLFHTFSVCTVYVVGESVWRQHCLHVAVSVCVVLASVCLLC
jgi:hypothetical protein